MKKLLPGGKYIVIFTIFLLSSCMNNVDNRIKYANEIAGSNHLKKRILKTSHFPLLTYSKISNSKLPLRVYIEGDGFAWRNRYTISFNPTPKNPVSLKIAAADKNPNVLYIARPCQYVKYQFDKLCNNKYWTGARFSKEVVDSTNEIIDKFVKKYQFKEVNLFGYSGGAAVAVIAAAKRDDVSLIGTVAGNLNHKLLMNIHQVTPLNDSLDAIDFARQVKDIEQFHLIGAKDKIVPAKVIMSFANRVNLLGGKAKFKIINDANHQYDKWGEVLLGL